MVLYFDKQSGLLVYSHFFYSHFKLEEKQKDHLLFEFGIYIQNRTIY